MHVPQEAASRSAFATGPLPDPSNPGQVHVSHSGGNCRGTDNHGHAVRM